MIPIPGGAEVLVFLGWPVEAHLVAQADVHAAQSATLARSYTRRRGFAMDEDSNPTVEQDIAAVIVSSAARSLSNPSAAKNIEAGNFNEAPGSFYGWSLVELVILQGWRRMAAG
jgi:hypothetical protein